MSCAARRSGRHGHRSWQRPNGMTIERVRVPLGVVGVIYESRPNVTADAGVLCLKSGNAVILRGGSDSFRSCRAIHDCLVAGPARRRSPRSCDHAGADARPRGGRHDAVGLDGAIDVIVPRGGKSLVARVDRPKRACRCSRISKASTTSISTSAATRHGEIDRAERQDAPHRRLRRGRDAAGRSRRRARQILKPLVEMLIDAGCEVRGDAAVQKTDARVKPASEDDWDTEYLDAIIAAKRGGRRRRRDRAYPASRLASHRRDRDRGCRLLRRNS